MLLLLLLLLFYLQDEHIKTTKKKRKERKQKIKNFKIIEMKIMYGGGEKDRAKEIELCSKFYSYRV